MRLKRLKRSLKKNERFPYLVTDLKNIKYLTGFSGSYANLIIDENRSYLISDSRYKEYAGSILPDSVEFFLQEEDFFKALKLVIKGTGKKVLYLEDHVLPLSNYLQVKKHLRGIKLIPSENEVNNLRMIKDDDEILSLRKAAGITDRCMTHLVKFIRHGMLEWDIAVEIEYFYRRSGCRRNSFEPIVAAGKGSSMPHYETSMTRRVKNGDVILIDMGCEYEGYNSDLTRTIFINSIDPELEKIYKIVREAQESAILSIRPGITTGKLDEIARRIIINEGYGEYFGHSLGHGLGLEVHELPAIKNMGELTIKKNMAFTIEPGIYIPDIGGVRIEDMVVVTGKGCELLTKASKDVIVI